MLNRLSRTKSRSRGLSQESLQGCEGSDLNASEGDGDGSQISPRMGQAHWVITWPLHGCSPKPGKFFPPEHPLAHLHPFIHVFASNIAPSQGPLWTVLAKNTVFFIELIQITDFFPFLPNYLSLSTPLPSPPLQGEIPQDQGPTYFTWPLAYIRCSVDTC